MAITLKRQLTSSEKEVVLKQHGRTCFATGHLVPDEETIQYDHIHAFARGGESEVNNIAPMCPHHNLAKGSLPLYDFRAKLKLDEFFANRDKLTLGHLLEHLRSSGEIPAFGIPISTQESGDAIRVESANFKREFQLSRCPVTGWSYFYATLPVEILASDDSNDQELGLQPRYLIPEKVFELFRHFQMSPVLQPSLGRIVDSKIRLFDGQHKAAAVFWNGHRELECKIYVKPDMRLLNQTNISAHEKFAQTRFYTSVIVEKLGKQFGADFNLYKNLEDGKPKSEAGFVSYLSVQDNLTRGEVNKRFQSFLYSSILEDESNRLARLIPSGNRPTEERPITLNGLTNSLFATFLCREPVDDNMTTEAYKRANEAENMVKLMNMLDELGLEQWNPKAPRNDDNQLKLQRLIRPKFMKAWSELLKDAVCAGLNLRDTLDRSRPFYREISPEELETIRFYVSRLVDWKMWSSPVNSEIDLIIKEKDGEVRRQIREKGLTVQYITGG